LITANYYELFLIHYYILLHITTYYCTISTQLLHHYYTIITNRFQLLHITMKLLSIHYYLLLHYNYAITTVLLHYYYAITTPLLLKSLLHITTTLLRHYYAITTHYYKILFHYYIITTSSFFASVTTHYYQVPLLPNPNYYVLLPLLPLLHITYRGNLQMFRVGVWRARCDSPCFSHTGPPQGGSSRSPTGP
jgi:hypothetical protein